jgi:hypothetical protein
MTVDRPLGQNWVVIRKAKGDQRCDATVKPIIAIPIDANPALAHLLEWYCTQRIAYCEKNLQQSPTIRDMELHTLRVFMRLASGCNTLRLAPRSLHRRQCRSTKWFQMDIAQPPQKSRLRS